MKKYTVNKFYRFDEKTEKTLKELYEKEALRKKMSETEFVRELIQRAKQEDIGMPRQDFIKMGRDLSGMGNNINQIAHKINMDMFTYRDLLDLRQCMEDVSRMRAMLKNLVEQMY